MRHLTPQAAEWPADLGPPPAADLWVQGARRLDRLAERAVAIIGTRDATPYGEHVAADLAHNLATRGWTVAGTGESGISAAAHRGALAADGPTLAVLGSGLHNLHPTWHVALFRRIRHAGLLVSEYEPHTIPTRSRALTRNRIPAGLCRAVVVVEAKRDGAALDIARWANAYGRPLMAVPGPVTSAASAGCHDLLRSGTAHLVTRGADILQVLEG